MPLRYARSRTGWEISVHFLRAFFSSEQRAWHGAEPPGKVFWGYGVRLFHPLASNENRIALQQALPIVLFAYTVWILAAIWRCAEGSIWGGLARGLTVVWAGNGVLVLAFLQMDLFAAHIGR
jgi:hypothetical protein